VKWRHPGAQALSGRCWVPSAQGPIQPYVAKKKPVRIIVRRGASRRFDSLRRDTADLPVEVSWDRRAEDRRESRQSPPVERRSGDRRKTPPFTWEVADFVVVDADQEPDATAAPRVTTLDSTATSTAGDRNQQRRPTNVDSYGHASVDDKFPKRSE
jgi:hypothetical protein